MKMVEGTKQVRVDNWGVFFLQRLQMFFNKTDYCDLTLQFEGNVQLKVHRLVINACTEYFTYLEQTYGLDGDVLIMPPDLQADVVLPIVNFMYTGMLEFHMSIFEKLYKTAELMNITVLTKLLDALKHPVQSPKSTLKKRQQVSTFTSTPVKKSVKHELDLPTPLPGRKLPVWKRKTVPNPSSNLFTDIRKAPSDPLAIYDSTPKPTRFEWPEDELPSLNLFDSTFDDISYTSKPLLTPDYDPKPSTSFEKNKDHQEGKSSSLSAREEVKEFIKEPRKRSNLSEFNTEENSSEMIYGLVEGQKRKNDDKTEAPITKKVRFNISEKENQNSKTTKLNITPIGKTSPDFSHSKIISEVLKRYPHIVKKNKNIKLKILAKNSNLQLSPEKVQTFKTSMSTMRVQVMNANDEKSQKSPSPDKKEEGPWRCLKCSTPTEPCDFILYYLYRKHLTEVHNEKFDSRLCKYCGQKCSKHNLLMYHYYTKHGIKPPPSYHFPKCSQCPYIALTENILIKHKLTHTNSDLQCPECKVAYSNRHYLNSHMQIMGHSGKSGISNYNCQYCTKKYHNGLNLFSHIKTQHKEEARRDGVISIDEEDYDELEKEDIEAYNEQIEQHREGEQEEEGEYITSEVMSEKKEKIKILSNVKVESKQLNSQEEQHNILLQHHSSESEALTSVASGIATSLGLVDIVVLDDNQQYILHSNSQHLAPTTSQSSNQNQSGLILPELTDTHTFTTSQQSNDQAMINQTMLNSSDIGSTDELVMVLTDNDYGDGNNEAVSNDSSNIVVLYSHPAVGNDGQFITTSQGNIMINSETGVFELRNSDSFVPISESSVLVNTGTHAGSPQIESIEMIQREIENHGKNDGKGYGETKPILMESSKQAESMEEIYMQQNVIIQQEEQQQQHVPTTVPIQVKEEITPRVELIPEQQVPMDVQEEGDAQMEQKQSEPDKSVEVLQMSSSECDNLEINFPEKDIEMETMVTSSEDRVAQLEKLHDHVDREIAKDAQEDAVEEAKENEEVVVKSREASQNENSEIVSDTTNEKSIAKSPPPDQTPESESDNKEPVNTEIDQRSKDENPLIEKTSTEIAPSNNAATSQTEEKEPVQMKEDNEDETREQYTEVIIDEAEENSRSQNSIPEEIMPEKIQEDEGNTSQDTLPESTCEELSEDVPEEGNVNNDNDESEDINNDLESEVSQDYSEKDEPSKPSAKTILDEWEDTDSQQSGNTEIRASNTPSTVHRLIDDWEEEEEEDSRKAND